MQDPTRTTSAEARLLGDSAAMNAVRRFIADAGAHSLPVMLLGESGSGKELVAQALALAAGAGRPWVALNCASLDDQLVLSELFGHERGAFTGACACRPGALERASGGTLFLDEVAELPRRAQAMLLRALETGEIWRLGGQRPLRVKFRLLTATHQDLSAAVQAGQFRADLFYRLHVLVLRLPPLRQRLDDLGPLCAHLLALDFPERRLRLSPTALARLREHAWPGNVRELRHVLARAVVLGGSSGDACLEASAIDFADIPSPGRGQGGTLAQLQEQAILTELARQGGHRQRTARVLGMSRATLYRRLERMSGA